MDIHYAIGDIHGRDDLLKAMHARIAADRRLRHGDAPAVIVHVGDYIDRGARSRDAIDRLMGGVPGFETVCLKGNHEDLMLACLDTDDPDVWLHWLDNGGDETVASLGLTFEFGVYDPMALAKALGAKRLGWLTGLKLTHRVGDYLFVHAGIVPGRPLEEQHEKISSGSDVHSWIPTSTTASASSTATHQPNKPNSRPTASASTPGRPGTET